jgi:maleylacetoacetate isomerase
VIKLYNYYRSSASFRVRIALNLKSLAYEDVQIHLVNNGGEQFSAEYQSINPQKLVPALEDNGKVITQSLAIIEYLNEVYPEPSLLPADAYQKSLVKSISLEIAADLHPLNNLRILKYLTNDLGLSDEKKNQWYQHWIAVGFQALEKKLATTSQHGEFCVGNSFSIADICLVPQMYNARRFSCDLTPYPTLVQIDANCQKHPAFEKAWPKEN